MSLDICDSEHLLGRRIVNYLRNKATVGRINTQKLKVVRRSCLQFFVKRTNVENSYIISNTGLIIKNKKTIKKCILLSKRQ